MPAPATVEELLDLIQKSGVADEAKVKSLLKKLKQDNAIPNEPGKLAGLLVREALLTYFQAEQLLQGKWKRFSIGKYKVLEKLGSGGMGQVFLCEHKLMRRRVAVKVLPTAKADDEASLGRFYREARAVAAVDHPNIVRAYDIDQDDNLHFLVMEYVDGTNLQDLVKKFGPLDPVRACHYIYGASVGLQHAHEIGLVHRDIKPGNILLDRSGVVKILDMGLARFFHDDTDNLTKQYDENILGTADYLSPEQAEDSHTVDIRSDIYSLGATFYYLLAGNQPFPEGSIPQKLIWHRSREPRSIRSIRPEVPDGIAAIVAKMMAKKPEDRYAIPADVMNALSVWVSSPIAPPADREMPQLSPAVSLGSTRSPSGASVAPWQGGGSPVSSSGPATLLAPGTLGIDASSSGGSETPTLTPGTVPSPSVNGVWESLDEDTQPLNRSETQHRSARMPQPPQPSATIEKKSYLLPLVLIASGVLLLIGGSLIAYFGFLKKKPTTDPTPPTGPRRLIVSKSSGENVYQSLGQAVRSASPGDTIAIMTERLHEPTIRIGQKKDITIESGLPDGRPVMIEFAGSAGSTVAFDLVNVENVKVKNVEFDGKGIVDYGVIVSGTCPGVVLDNISVRGVKKAGFHFFNVAGDTGRPVLLDRFRVALASSNEAAVCVAATGLLESRKVSIRNGRIEGQGLAGFRFDGAMSDIEVSGNRVFKVGAGFHFFRVPVNRTAQVRISSNTIYDAKIGLDITPAGMLGRLDVQVTQNYFAKTLAITTPSLPPPAAAQPPIAGVRGAENGHDTHSGLGNTPIGASIIQSPELPIPNPAIDAEFLRFPAGGPQPEVGPNKVRVGAF